MSLNLTPERQTALEDAQTLANTSLIEPKDAVDIVLLDSADQATSREIERIMGEVDLKNSNSIIHFGSAAQEELQLISQSMLVGVKNKDLGPAGDSLRDIVTTLRELGHDVDVHRAHPPAGLAVSLEVHLDHVKGFSGNLTECMNLG
ncbi:MAG: hypothetical protein EBY35_11155, partial [Rhodobacteraceae bacterium]|nr:hypothetical protein [Paracoccaceae bacterium]